MPLADTAIRNAKPADKARKLFDGGGLYLEVAPSGGKWWRLKYRYGGKEKRLSLGVYPDVSLKDARERRDEARKLLANDIDPSEHRQAQKAAKEDRAANSFEVVAREWHAKHLPSWTDKHAETIIRRLELNVFPWLGGKPIADITAPQLLQVIRRIEQRGALETAHRVLGCCGQVFRYAVATGRAERDPSGDLRGALPPVKSQHFAAVTEPDKIAAVLRAIDGYEGTLPVRCALRLAPLVFVRPGELRKAEWADIDLDAAEWRYTVTKTNTPHIVPLSRQAVAILRELQPLTGRGRYVFPSARSASRPMSGTNPPGADLDAPSAPEGGAPGMARIKAQRRAGARQAGRQPSLPVAPRKRQRRGEADQKTIRWIVFPPNAGAMDGGGRSFKRSGTRSSESRPAEAAEPVAQQPAMLNSTTAQPAAEPQALGPVFWGEGRSGGARAGTKGTELDRSHGASLPELAEAVWRP